MEKGKAGSSSVSAEAFLHSDAAQSSFFRYVFSPLWFPSMVFNVKERKFELVLGLLGIISAAKCYSARLLAHMLIFTFAFKKTVRASYSPYVFMFIETTAPSHDCNLSSSAPVACEAAATCSFTGVSIH